jgi:hypothetical protein
MKTPWEQKNQKFHLPSQQSLKHYLVFQGVCYIISLVEKKLFLHLFVTIFNLD